MKEDNNDNFSEVEVYLGIQSEQCEDGPSVCIEFPISCRVFIIALALAQLEKKCDENENKDE